MKPPLAVALVLALAAPLLLLGCGSDTPTKPPPATPAVAPDRSTPTRALQYMAAAFANRDSVKTDSVYADDYQGSSLDLTYPNPVPYDFVKSDEVRAVGEMARSNITYAIMNLGPSVGWLQGHYASDPPEWVYIQVPTFQIYINDADRGEFEVRSPSIGVTQAFEFTLRPNPDPASPTSTTWTIVRWVEFRAQN